MRFEPRVIQPDDEDDGLDLPADLLLLAEQLQEDAQRIAAAQTSTRPLDALSRPVAARRWPMRAAVAALLVSAGAWSALRLYSGAPHEPHAVGPLLQVARDADSRGESKREVDTALPAVFFQELTGPEKEGLLDLLEQKSLEQSSLSI